MMPTADQSLLDAAQTFAEDIADLLDRTVAEAAPIKAVAHESRVVVSPISEDGETTTVPLMVAGEHRLDLRLSFWCDWDFAKKFLAVDRSEFALKIPHLREALVRFDYLHSHSWAPSHVQIHAESAALGWLHSFTGTTKPPKVQQLHLPTGGKRFRPSLEDVLEFAIHDLAVEAKPGATARIEEGRRRWERLQLAAAIRDAVKADPAGAPASLRKVIDEADAAVQARSQGDE